MAYTQDQARQILASGQGSPEELSAANAAYYGAQNASQPGGGGFYGQQTQPQQPMPGADNGALGYNNPGSQFYTPNQNAAPMAQGFAGASNDPGIYTTPDYIKNLNQNMMGWQANKGNAAGFSQGQFDDAWQKYMSNPMQFNPDAYNQAMGITNANGTENIWRNGQQVGVGQMSGQSGQGQFWGNTPQQSPAQGPQSGGNGAGPAPNPSAPQAGGMGMGQMPGQSGPSMGGQAGMAGGDSQWRGQSPLLNQGGQAGAAGMGMGQGSGQPLNVGYRPQGTSASSYGPMQNAGSGNGQSNNWNPDGTWNYANNSEGPGGIGGNLNQQFPGNSGSVGSPFTGSMSFANGLGGLQGMSGQSGGAGMGGQYAGSMLGQNPLSMPGNMGGMAQLGNALQLLQQRGGYNSWGNPSQGNPFSYMTGQPGVRGANSGPQYQGNSFGGFGSPGQNFYNPSLTSHNVRG